MNHQNEKNIASNVLLISILGLSVLVGSVTADMVNPVLGVIGKELGAAVFYPVQNWKPRQEYFLGALNREGGF